MSTSDKSPTRAIITSLLFAAVVALIIFYLFADRSRPLYVVNHTPQAMTVKLQNGFNHELEPNTWVETSISIEPQLISLFQGQDSVGAVELDPTSFTQKDDGILVYNIEAAGIIVWEEIVYSDDPEILETTEGDWRISVGEEIKFFENADYVFEESPDEIFLTSTDGYELQSQLTFLDWKPMEVSDWLAVALDDTPVESTMSYMEKQIQLGHDELFFIENYFDYAESNDEMKRAESIMSNHGWSQKEWIDVSHENNPDDWGIAFNQLEENLAGIAALDSIVVDQRNARLVLAFPLDTTFSFDIQALSGRFSLEELIQQTGDVYSRIYEEEKNTSTIKPLHIEDDAKGHKRNETNGTYGIWGFHLEDLMLSGFSQLRHDDTQYIIAWVYEDY